MKALEEMCSIWRTSHLDDKNEHQRNADIFSKRITKYFLLRFINLSMMDIEKEKQNKIEKRIIEIFQKLKKKDEIPESLTVTVDTACHSFMLWFDSRKREICLKN